MDEIYIKRRGITYKRMGYEIIEFDIDDYKIMKPKVFIED